MAPLYRGADGPNCKDIINGIAFSMPFCCILLDTAIFLVMSFILFDNLASDNDGTALQDDAEMKKLMGFAAFDTTKVIQGSYIIHKAFVLMLENCH